MNTTNSNAPTLVGRVVSDKRDKTITILIERKNSTSFNWKNNYTHE